MKRCKTEAEAERQTLCCIFLNPDNIRKVDLRSTDFHSDECRRIYEAMMEIEADSGVENINTARIASITNIPLPEIQKLLNLTFTDSELEDYVRIVKEASVKRSLKNYMADNLEIECVKLLSGLEDFIAENKDRLLNREDKSTNLFEIIKEGNKISMELAGRTVKCIGIESGLKKLDEYTSGWANGQYVIIAGRPSIGKSALSIQWALNAAKHDIPGLIISNEMTKRMYYTRIMSSHLRITHGKIVRGYLKRDELNSMFEFQKDTFLQNLKFEFNCDDEIVLREMVERHVMKNNIKYVIMDHLQQWYSHKKTASREQELSLVSRAVKALAFKYEIPFVVIAQLNRKCEDQQRAPILSDLRDTGSIEQDADVVIFIHDESKIENRRKKKEYIVSVMNNERLCIIAKNRDGRQVQFKLIWDGDLQTYYNHEDGGISV